MWVQLYKDYLQHEYKNIYKHLNMFNTCHRRILVKLLPTDYFQIGNM